MSQGSSKAADSGFAGDDVRPVVPTGGGGNWGFYGFLVVLAAGGLVLFNALSASRQASQVPSILVPNDDIAGQIASPSPLRVPERFQERREVSPDITAPPEPDPVEQRPAPKIPSPALPPPPVFQPNRPLPSAPLSPELAQPRVVFENRGAINPGPVRSSENDDAERVTADRFLNPSRTIPQGTVIPAVLETALDSTRAGGVRALVQRDVSSFDGSRVLIPRGSRLYGEYEANLERGQNRALVQWTRLIRPDGVTIALNSPSSDPLGRAGIRGKVDSKFFQRFGGAILQSVLDIGVGLAVNEATDGVFVALPGSTQNVQIAEPDSIQPTLKVKHGTSVSVFVARDLDFSTVEP